MKKIILLLLISILTYGVGYSQEYVYSKIKIMNKYEKMVDKSTKKTRILELDSMLVIDTEKANGVLVYAINTSKTVSLGSKDMPTNLVDNVWGYETQYYTWEGKKVVIRTLTTKNGEFLDRLAWLETENGDRLIYTTH